MSKENLQKVKVVQDDSGHWFIIPANLLSKFYNDLEDEEFLDSGGFDEEWGEWRTGGDLNLVQLWADKNRNDI